MHRYFPEVARQVGIIQFAEFRKLLAGQPPGAGQAIVEIDGLAMNAYFRPQHQPRLRLNGLGNRTEAPTFSTLFNCLPYPAIRNRQELNLPLGDPGLEQFIPGKRQVHAVGVGPNQNMFGIKYKIHRLG